MMMAATPHALLLALAVLPAVVRGYDNGLGRTPQMGWNSWNHFGCTVNESVIKATADAFLEKNLPKYGYKYVNVDDCWAGSRSSNGSIQPDNTTFPDFQDMIDYVHSKGLLFGLYSDAGNKTCAGRPGSLGYETQDANTYAGWKVDYLKYDNCNNDGVEVQKRYEAMHDALNKTGHPIFYSLCEWGQEDPATWAPAVGNSWRTTDDIQDNWNSMISNADNTNLWWSFAGPYGWNDPDMLEVGNGGMSEVEYTTHFSLWCLMKAPLLIGADITKLSETDFDILTNTEAIAVNQDSLGVQGNKRWTDDVTDVWAGPLADPTPGFAVLLLNRGDIETNVTATWKDVGLSPTDSAEVRDLWLHKDLGVRVGSVTASVPSHGAVFYRLTPMTP